MKIPLIVPTPSGYSLAKKIADNLNHKNTDNCWVPVKFKKFGDGDHTPEILRHIRGEHVFIIADVQSHSTIIPEHYQSHQVIINKDNYELLDKNNQPIKSIQTKQPFTTSFDELVLTIEAVKNAVDDGRVTVVIPFLPSSRQERRQGREAANLKIRYKILELAGADHVLTIDNHAKATDLVTTSAKLDNLHAIHAIIPELKVENGYFVAPDAGAYELNKKYAQSFKVLVAFVKKARDQTVANKVEGINGFEGDITKIKNKNIFMVDDMVDTGSTLIQAAEFLINNGANNVSAIATHGIFSNGAIKRLGDAVNKKLFKEIIVTNSISINNPPVWLKIIDISKLLAKTIDNLNRGKSISNYKELTLIF